MTISESCESGFRVNAHLTRHFFFKGLKKIEAKGQEERSEGEIQKFVK